MNEVTVLSEVPNDLTVSRAPDLVLAEAQRAAWALKDVISKKEKPVMFNGQQYLEFEDWQTIGKFYGLLCSTKMAEEITVGGVVGAKASATVTDIRTGKIVGEASAWCLRDEPNWKSKPWYQLGSMAQTRAGAKALRNLLSWVVVLAGYKTTPAEELDHSGTIAFERSSIDAHLPVQKAVQDIANRVTGVTKGWPHPGKSGTVQYISEKQAKRFYAIAKGSGASDEEIKNVLQEMIGTTSTKMIPLDKYDEVCQRFQSGS